MTPKLVVLQSWKKLQVLEKDFFSKKIPQLIRVDKTFKTVCGNFLILMGLEIFILWWFYGSEKLLFTIKSLMKLDWQKIKKIPHTI